MRDNECTCHPNAVAHKEKKMPALTPTSPPSAHNILEDDHAWYDRVQGALPVGGAGGGRRGSGLGSGGVRTRGGGAPR